MTFEEYVREIIENKIEHPEWRWGQTAINVLRYSRNDLYEHIKGAGLYDACKIESLFWPLLEYLRASWIVSKGQ